MASAYRSTPNFLLPKFLLRSFYIINIVQKSILWFVRTLGLPSSYCIDYDVDNDIVPHHPTEQSDKTHHLVDPVELIRKTLPVVKFGDYLVISSTTDRRSSRSQEEESSCSICLCKFERQDEIRGLMDCPHIFHRTCLDSWMDHGSNNTTCPLCRTPLISPELVIDDGVRINSFRQNSNLIEYSSNPDYGQEYYHS